MRLARAGVEAAALVNGEEKDGGIVLEEVLRAVAVMHVPVEDHNLLQAEHVLRVTGGYGNVVEEAEAHGLVVLGVVA